MTTAKLQKLIRVARGEIPADLVLKGGKVVNVFSCEIQQTDVAISEDQIVGAHLKRPDNPIRKTWGSL
jgi:adenine deaminase